MQKTQYYFLTATLFALAMLAVSGGIYIFELNRQQRTSNTSGSSTTISSGSSSTTANNPTSSSLSSSQPRQMELTISGLSAFNGRDGNKCYVAVDGTIYEIFGSSLWLNGQHTTSFGRASCGRDLTQVIEMSPHGRAYLSLPVIKKIGVIVN